MDGSTHSSPPVTTAVILAAGLGSRLQPVWGAAPKGLLPLGDLPIIERSIQQLLRHGVTKLVLVTGYQAAQFASLAARYPAIKTVHNPHFATSGSMYSLYCARDLLPDAFLLLECDLIYEDRALSTLLACPHASALVVTELSGGGDEVLVEAEGQRLKRTSKQRAALATIAGEQIGISKISPRLFQSMTAYAEYVFRSDLNLEYYSDCLNAVADAVSIFCCTIPELIWAEIDDGAQWQRARDIIFPRLQAASPQPFAWQEPTALKECLE